MIYKTLKKVSEYCQLIKPNFLSSQSAGLTVTSNGDTFIVNGTSTKRTTIGTTVKNWTPIIGHKILVCGCPEGGGNNTFAIGAFNQSGVWDYGKGGIGTVITTGTWFGILFESGITFDNLVFKPQLFDLTEMYGAGNEPTTVEEFRTKFPNELYDYKPYCFVKSYKTLLKTTDDKIITSYKKSLRCTTKNLFDISKVPTISGQLIVKDNSICSYAYPVVINDTNLLSIFKSLKPDTNYTMSATTLNYLDAATNYIVLIFSNALGDKIIFYNYSAGFNKVTFSLTQEQINNITNVYFYGRDESSGGPVMWSNIQLEEGSNATEYHPYGYL